MRLFLFSFLTLVPLSSAMATYDMTCTVPFVGGLTLHIEDDAAEKPEHWDLKVNGEKVFSKEPATLTMTKNYAHITVKPSDEMWRDYRFTFCKNEEEKGKAEIMTRFSADEEFKPSSMGQCHCTED